jgi:hypothetical protein
MSSAPFPSSILPLQSRLGLQYRAWVPCPILVRISSSSPLRPPKQLGLVASTQGASVTAAQANQAFSALRGSGLKIGWDQATGSYLQMLTVMASRHLIQGKDVQNQFLGSNSAQLAALLAGKVSALGAPAFLAAEVPADYVRIRMDDLQELQGGVTTVNIGNTGFIKDHPATVTAYLAAWAAARAMLLANPDSFRSLALQYFTASGVTTNPTIADALLASYVNAARSGAGTATISPSNYSRQLAIVNAGRALAPATGPGANAPINLPFSQAISTDILPSALKLANLPPNS